MERKVEQVVESYLCRVCQIYYSPTEVGSYNFKGYHICSKCQKKRELSNSNKKFFLTRIKEKKCKVCGEDKKDLELQIVCKNCWQVFQQLHFKYKKLCEVINNKVETNNRLRRLLSTQTKKYP
jgi:hypothetical protein